MKERCIDSLGLIFAALKEILAYVLHGLTIFKIHDNSTIGRLKRLTGFLLKGIAVRARQRINYLNLYVFIECRDLPSFKNLEGLSPRKSHTTINPNFYAKKTPPTLHRCLIQPDIFILPEQHRLGVQKRKRGGKGLLS